LDEVITEDFLKVELLQLTALLIQYAPNSISDIRKDLIKFAWKHFKNDDTICKQAAYVVLARFIREYDTPVKIVIQIYVALLRAYQAEGKILAKQALDIVLPVLPQRMSDGGSESKMATWVRWTRKIIVEEGHNTSQLVMIYQLILRHADQFYDSRDHFIPHIIFSLAKLGLSPNATAETRTLTMDMSEVLLTWERTAIQQYQQNNRENKGKFSFN
jgi:transformation/transcription domain-associated protein